MTRECAVCGRASDRLLCADCASAESAGQLKFRVAPDGCLLFRVSPEYVPTVRRRGRMIHDGSWYTATREAVAS